MSACFNSHLVGCTMNGALNVVDSYSDLIKSIGLSALNVCTVGAWRASNIYCCLVVVVLVLLGKPLE